MSRLAYKTIGGVSPQGKPNVYFACHPDDQKKFLDEYAMRIMRIQDCAIWYETEYDKPFDYQELKARLTDMQLIIMPVTTKLLTEANRAISDEFFISQEYHIPILPIMLEQGLDNLYKDRVGNLQYIDPSLVDSTRRSFDEVLQTYIRAVLVGDELANKVRNAFDAHIFLSYRKKDWAQARKLMRLIHKNPMCQDIAIWYDGFLIPGEDFNDVIRNMIKKCDLFALAVTPNLVNELNYVQTREYPIARDKGKTMLPVEMEETDRTELTIMYSGIPECVKSENEDDVWAALLDILHTDTLSEKGTDLEHNFFIGLAYLDGIDVEVDFERAVRLITGAAEAGVPEAMEQLVTMYETGKGVARDYYEGVKWRQKYVEYLKNRYEEEPGIGTAVKYYNGLFDMGDALYALRNLDEAKEVFENMLILSLKYESMSDAFKRRESVSYSRLGNIAIAQGQLSDARTYYEKGLKISLALAEETGTIESRRDLSVSYNKIGDIAQAQGQLSDARTYYEKGLEIRLALVEETGTIESRRDLSVSYNKIGDIAQAQGQLSDARAYYEKGLKIRLALAEETGTIESSRDLSVSYNKIGDIAQAQGQLAEARNFYEKCLEIRLALAEETGTIESRRDLSISYEKMGNIAKAQGRLSDARAYYEKGLAIRLALAEETGTIESRRDLSISYNKMGDIAQAQGQLSDAQAYYEKYLEISLALAEKTGALESRRDLLVSYDKMGNIAQEQGQLIDARQYYEKELEISVALAEETGTFQSYDDLQISYFNYGAFLLNNRIDSKESNTMFQQVVKIGEESEYPQLKERGKMAQDILNTYF